MYMSYSKFNWNRESFMKIYMFIDELEKLMIK